MTTIIGAVGVILIAWGMLKFALPVLSPFIVALMIGEIVSPIADRVAKRTGLPRWLVGAFIMILAIIVILSVVALALDRLLHEVMRLSESLAENGGGEIGRSINSVISYLSSLTENLPVLRELRATSGADGFWIEVDKTIANMMSNAASSVASWITSCFGRVLTALPTVIVTFTVTFIASFYFCTGSCHKQLKGVLSTATFNKLSVIAKKLKKAFYSWFRAYLLIMVLTFFELFVGLSIIGVSYSFLAALLISAVDILPIFGIGIALLPWSAVAFFMGNYRMGIGLLAIYAVISLVRQIVEPKIVGKSLGIPPILSLISTYVGLKLFGFFGMLAGPAVIALICAMLPMSRGERTKQRVAAPE